MILMTKVGEINYMVGALVGFLRAISCEASLGRGRIGRPHGASPVARDTPLGSPPNTPHATTK